MIDHALSTPVETPAGNARYCRHLLATLWQPLLLRLLTLAAALTPPQVRRRQLTVRHIKLKARSRLTLPP